MVADAWEKYARQSVENFQKALTAVEVGVAADRRNLEDWKPEHGIGNIERIIASCAVHYVDACNLRHAEREAVDNLVDAANAYRAVRP